MPDPAKPHAPPPETTGPAAGECEAEVCERCGSASVYRMHAVWRCAHCGYKTDCCGW